MISIDEIRNTRGSTICLGLHGPIIQSILDFEYMSGFKRPSIDFIVASGRRQERFFWGGTEIVLPVEASLTGVDVKRLQNITHVLNMQSGRRVLNAAIQAVDLMPNLMCMVIFAEQVPELHATRLIATAANNDILIIGPSSVGIVVPGAVKLGPIGGVTSSQILAAHIADRGNIAVLSTSGGMVNELIHTVTKTNNRLSFALALGGERFPVCDPASALLLAEHDTQTKAIVYFGELGGTDEYTIADLIRRHKLTKPIYAYIAGTAAELFPEPPQFGHAKALAQTHNETASAKRQALMEVGVRVAETLGDIEGMLRSQKGDSPLDVATKMIPGRKKAPLVSQLSGDINGELHVLGRPIADFAEAGSFTAGALSLLLGRSVKSTKLNDYFDYALHILVDHGPYVSGALNTIVTARAGRDLVSSLASGLLTIGPRFGGAVNGAAGCWLKGVSGNISAREFVENFHDNGGIIPGIGHKKYRLNNPDPRILSLQKYLGADVSGRYLEFARAVEAVTTAKKGTLILNVDGYIAATLLDLIESELGYDQRQLESLVDTEFFNAVFVLARSVGFMSHYMDQRRHDEGLYRADDGLIAYIPPEISMQDDH